MYKRLESRGWTQRTRQNLSAPHKVLKFGQLGERSGALRSLGLGEDLGFFTRVLVQPQRFTAHLS